MSPLFLLVKFREDAITYLELGQEFNLMVAVVVAAVSSFCLLIPQCGLWRDQATVGVSFPGVWAIE